jgi:hypothetical protein
MLRLLVKFGSTVRRVANVDIANHDGSINLSLVRAGTNGYGWTWDSSRSDFDKVEYAEPKPKTKRITIHTSGRVNYHVSPNSGVNFIPCLLDLTEAVPFVAYVIPAVTALDLAGNMRSGDHIVELDDGSEGALGFEFFVLPFNVPPLPGEIWRFIVEGRYGLACVLVSGALFPIRPGVPAESFSVIRPSSLLPKQSIPEEQAFIRFQELMHANQVRQALMSSEIPEHTHDQIVEETVMVGRGIQGPNNEGVWEVVCNVPMRIRPALVVQFLDPRYRAEMIDVTSTDKRLEKVRIRFKVYDQQAKKWVKHPVEILKAFLDAEL